MPIHLTPPPADHSGEIDPRSSHRLYQVSLGALIAACAFLAWKSPIEDLVLRGIGIAILILATWPAISWAKHGRTWFPAFEIFMLTNVNFYAIPLLTSEKAIQPFITSTVWEAALTVMLYLLAAIITFTRVRGSATHGNKYRESMLPDKLLHLIPLGLVLSTIYLYVSRFTDLISYDLQGTMRAIFLGIGTIGTFVYARRYGAGHLGRGALVFLCLNVLAQVILLTSKLYLISAISVVILALIGYTSSSRRIPWIPLAILLPVFAVLHAGKSNMRDIYWAEDAPEVAFTQLPGFFTQWVEFGLHPAAEPDEPTLTTGLLQRASLFQMLCLSIERVPDQQPYLYGDSYIDVPALLIPRFLWPNKPSALQSNVRLALYFGLVTEQTAYKVSIAFGMLSEAYINFGIVGAVMLGALFGWALKHLAVKSDGAPYFSALGLFMVVVTAWSFQAEQVFATWVTSLFQCAIVVIGLPLAYRHFFNPR